MSQEKIALLKQNIGKIIFGKDDIIEYAIIALLARGQLLIEDVPGVGKSSLAHSLASSLHLDFKRIQFTNDLLPADITGISIYDQGERKFHQEDSQNSLTIFQRPPSFFQMRTFLPTSVVRPDL